MMDRGTWDKHAALVQLALSPFNGGWHFIVECREQWHRDGKMVSLVKNAIMAAAKSLL